MRKAQARTRGFTLVEILIVVVILGILAAIVVPAFTSASDEARRASFAQDLRVFSDAAEYYQSREGTPIPDGSSGTMPPEWAGYVDHDAFEAGTSVGGVWDTEYNDSGVTSAVGVHFNGTGMTRDDAFMLQIDEIADDGDLSTGTFRKLADSRYYRVLIE
jgi:type IV pilus assembly protein PilA